MKLLGRHSFNLMNRTGRKLWGFALVVGFLVFLFSSSALPVPAVGETIRFGVYDNPPLVEYTKNEKPEGFVIDILSEVGERENWEIVYVPCTWTECLEKLKNGEIDLLGPLGYSEERAVWMDFTTEPMLVNWGQVYVPRGSQIRAIPDLDEKTLVVLKGDIYITALEDLLEQFDIRVNWILVDTYDEVFRALDQHQADAGVVNRLYGSKHWGELDITETGIVFNPIEVHFATQKGRYQEILSPLDAFLLEAKAEPSSLYHQSLEQWILGAPQTKLPSWIPWAGALLVFIAGTFGIASLVLRRQVHQRTLALENEIGQRKDAERKLLDYTNHLEDIVAERTDALRQAMDALIQKEKLAVLGQLAGAIGRELRNPLGVIGNAVYFLRNAYTQPEAIEYLNIIQEEVKIADRIINNLIDYAEPRQPLPERIRVAPFVQQVLQKKKPPENIEVELSIDDPMPALRVDPLHLEQVLFHLLQNAYDAMPQGGRLLIRYHEDEWDDTLMCLAVEDTGKGIPQQDLDKLFQPLFTTKARGMGLGLAMVKQLVELNQGRVSIQSQVDVGTTVTVWLPRYPAVVDEEQVNDDRMEA